MGEGRGPGGGGCAAPLLLPRCGFLERPVSKKKITISAVTDATVTTAIIKQTTVTTAITKQ